MRRGPNRREVLGSVALAALERPAAGAERYEIRVGAISTHTVRIRVLPVEAGRAAALPEDGALARADWPEASDGPKVEADRESLAFVIRDRSGREVQRLKVDAAANTVRFTLGEAPVLGMGQGGPQFDRRGAADRMRSGQGGYRLRTHGGRVPIAWLIGTGGWAIWFHTPGGALDLSGAEGVWQAGRALPLDVFIVASGEPAVVMGEWARMTGKPEMPPRWSLGYQQSHRTLASAEEILSEARTFREKGLPCDTMIYLGTGFCPSGWNTANGSFGFNKNVFARPHEILDALHAAHFKVVLHAVILERTIRGRAGDGCPVERLDMEEAACAWAAHRKVFALGVDGWWPDEGDALDAAARLARIRMYWEGAQMDRPQERPFALHRNGHAGMQRYAPFLWSGDVYATWKTLKTHVPVAINTGLSGIPYWGADIGGFVPTRELTGELYARWFQFGAFCPLFRAHGRTWKLRLPWGWNTGELGPNEITSYGEAANPGPEELRNAAVEPVCRKYLELRYRLMPYLYSAVRETCETGWPVMRALWLHYPRDPRAVRCGDEYLWGRDMLVAPVTEKGATERRVYLPAGDWYDFWTNERMPGGRELTRRVDLETLPLFVRAGAVLPLGPVKQYTEEPAREPVELRVYPGADGAFRLYDDDGRSFAYRRGEWCGVELRWRDQERRLELALAAGSKMPAPGELRFAAGLAGSGARVPVRFRGQRLEVRL